jgi:dihydropteroate synthase
MAKMFRTWTLRDRELRGASIPLLMGILNTTPDSFSDGGRYLDAEAAVEHGLSLVEDGADILDVGGESTRPGAALVTVEEELRRTIPVIRALVGQTNVPLSIDTTKAEVARQALEAGAEIVNDISGLRFDPKMPDVCAGARAGVVCMHMQGTPQTMQDAPHYDDAVTEIRAYFEQRLSDLEQAGIEPRRIVLDPGVGFGKTAEHNLEVLSHIDVFRALGCPVLIGHSRKRFLSKVLGRPVEERTFGTIGVAVALAAQSTDILRVHDVRAVRDALVAWAAVDGRIDRA